MKVEKVSIGNSSRTVYVPKKNRKDMLAEQMVTQAVKKEIEKLELDLVSIDGYKKKKNKQENKE